MTAPGIGWVLGYTIAAEIGDIARFTSPAKLAGYIGLCPRVYQSGGKDHRGPLAKNGPKYRAAGRSGRSAGHRRPHEMYGGVGHQGEDVRIPAERHPAGGCSS